MFKGALEKRGLVQKEKRRADTKTQVLNQNFEILLSNLPEGRSLNENFTDSGFMFEDAGPGTLGAALGTKTATPEDGTEQLIYEIFYEYPLNDGMTITPLIYHKEFSAANTPDQTGILVKTSFSF